MLLDNCGKDELTNIFSNTDIQPMIKIVLDSGDADLYVLEQLKSLLSSYISDSFAFRNFIPVVSLKSEDEVRQFVRLYANQIKQLPNYLFLN